jgi:carboxypeptidase C (cathepsin A)
LAFEADDDYTVLSLQVNRGWKWDDADRMGYVNVTDDLRRALLANPHLKVIIANGLYDLATPFFAAEYTADHLAIGPILRKNVALTYYEAGHMMYFHPPSLSKLRDDLAEFYDDALAP